MMKLLAIAAVMSLPTTVAAQYTASVVGFWPDNTPVAALTLNPGDTFSGAVVLSGPANTRNDSAVFRLVFSEPGLVYGPGWYQWGAPYVTNGPDDFTLPGPLSSGVLGPGSYNDPAHPGQTDAGFENVTPNFGDYFLTGQLVRFTLQVPANSSATVIEIAFANGSFTNGAQSVGVANGASLLITVVPSPATAVAGVLGLAWSSGRPRRRRVRALVM